jgi:hypothetical protein
MEYNHGYFMAVGLTVFMLGFFLQFFWFFPSVLCRTEYPSSGFFPVFDGFRCFDFGLGNGSLRSVRGRSVIRSGI